MNDTNSGTMKTREFNIWRYFYDTLRYKYATFSGRASREEFLSFIFMNYFITMGISLIGDSFIAEDSSISFFIWFSVFCLYHGAIFIPYTAVTVRRLHDSNRSGWILVVLNVLLLLPIVYFILTSIEPLFDLVVLFVRILATISSQVLVLTEYPWLFISYIIGVTMIIIYMWYFLLRKTQPNDNQYGPSLLNHKE